MVNATMPEVPNSKLCLVKSFMTYMSKLHPRCDRLWQHPKKVENISNTDIWYKPSKMGNNPLVTFMSCLSHDADLSHVYTNHSIRSTATTFLGRANFIPKQIMSVTGHHSLNSLAVYQKVSQNEKLAMGMAMNMYLQSNEQPRKEVQPPQCPVPIAPKPPQAALGVPPKDRNEGKRTEIINYEPEDPLLQDDFNQELDFNVVQVLDNIEKENFLMTQFDQNNSTFMTVHRQTLRRSPNVPIFNNCKIGGIQNLHIHIHKN